MRFQQILLHKNETSDTWDVTLTGVKLDKAIKILNDVLENQKSIYYEKEFYEKEGRKKD